MIVTETMFGDTLTDDAPIVTWPRGRCRREGRAVDAVIDAGIPKKDTGGDTSTTSYGEAVVATLYGEMAPYN